MRKSLLFGVMLVILLAACGPATSERVPVAQLPNPAIYALGLGELPDVGSSWGQTYNQTSTQQGYKWTYLAYQAYQPGSTDNELDSAYAVNNDIYLYENDMRRADLPVPPTSLGQISGVTWQPGTQLHRVGDKSAVWHTTLGDQLTPVWWLEFYKQHAYVRISLFGFPDELAPSLIYGLADALAGRLPSSNAELIADAGTPAPAVAQSSPTVVSSVSPQSSPAATATHAYDTYPVISYSAPPGDTGAVSFADETGRQLTDGVFGSDDLLADLGKGPGYEWVGWVELTEPVTITFTLAEPVEVSAVVIGVNHREGLAVFVPESVSINGEIYTLGKDAVSDNHRGDLTFTGPFQGPVITVVLSHRGTGWLAIDEVRFLK